jgi:hypothetical protein
MHDHQIACHDGRDALHGDQGQYVEKTREQAHWRAMHIILRGGTSFS